MPYSSGTYSLPSGNPVVTGTTISSSTTNTTNSDIATALSTCVLKDGTQTITANLPMASHKLTGLSAGTTAGDSVEYGGSPSFTNLAYTGTLTGSTGILNIGSGQVYKDASGNVGIGTSNPSRKLHVEGTTTNSGVLVSNVTSGLNIGMIGNYATWQGSGTSDDFVISGYGARDLVLGTNGTLRMLINASGNVGIGTTAVSYGTGLPHKQSLWFDPAVNNDGLFIACTAASGTAALFYTNTAGSPNAAGSITVLNATTLYNVSSDQRLKSNIKPSGSATQSILDFPIDSFDWNDSGMHVSFGGVAQKILPIVPEMVHVPDDPDAMMGIDWSKAVPRLIKTIQEQQTLIEALTERLTALEAK